jgi:hypothetical protein
MSYMPALLILVMTIFTTTALAEEDSPRIKRKTPSLAEADQIASDVALNDSLLRKDDIVVTIASFSFFVGSGQTGSATTSCRCQIPCPARNGNSSRFSGLG